MNYNQDPKELKGFSSTDDRPDNNGSYLDEERLNPPGIVRNIFDEGEGVEDDWDSFSNDEMFD